MLLLDGQPIDMVTYPNNETLLRPGVADPVWYTSPKEMTITLRFDSDDDLFRLQVLAKFLRNAGHPVNLVIPYMPYSRADRSQDGSIFTLQFVSEIINDLEFRRVTVYEAHSDVTVQLLNRCHNVEVIRYMVPQILSDSWGFNPNMDWLVFPDAGAAKRYFDVAPEFPVLFGTKVRNFKTGKIEGITLPKIIPAPGATALIVDDLCSRGGTFIQAAKLLADMGFSYITLLVAHMEKAGYNKDLLGAVDRIHASDSITPPRTTVKVRLYPLEGIPV